MLQLLYRVMQPCAIYRGVIITHTMGTYKAIGKTFHGLQEAKDAIDQTYLVIANSIKNPNITVNS